MTHKLDHEYFHELAEMDPGDVCRRCIATYDADRKVYRVTALEREYEIDPGGHEIKAVDPDDEPVSVELALTIIFYLLKAKDIPLTQKWVSEVDLKGGEMFFRGPHIIRNDAVAETYGRDIDAFKEACKKLGGDPVDMGDAAFKMRVLPRVPVVVTLWIADDEFEASAKLLFDSSIEQHLPLDVIFGMSLEVLGKVVGKHLWH